MDNDLDLTIAQVIKKYGLLDNRSHAKSLGQHFLCDTSLLDKIVSCAMPINDDDIIEVGPGPCGLTRSIIKFAKKNRIICIEKDTALEPVHKNLIANSDAGLKFIYEDALKIKPQSLSANNITIISNLPYNVGTQIFLNWLSDLSGISKMVLMFQKEVADRICAKSGTKDYGRLSVISQLLCETEKCFDVANVAFYPPPKVCSTVIRLVPKKQRPKDISKLERLTSLCFQHRRKTIFSNLKKVYKNAEECLTECSVPLLSRPEDLPPEKFLELSERFENA